MDSPEIEEMENMLVCGCSLGYRRNCAAVKAVRVSNVSNSEILKLVLRGGK